MKKNKKETLQKRVTFTKRWTAIILGISCIWITLSYVLAFFGKDQIAETLSETVATVIIATFIPYLCKSYFETFASEKNRIKEKVIDKQVENNNEEEQEEDSINI